jgi:hypothetical protein
VAKPDLLYCIGRLSIANKILEIINLKEAHTFRGFSPWLAGSIALRPMAWPKHHGRRLWQRKTAHLRADSRQREKERKEQRTKYTLQRHAHSDLLPPSPYLLIFPSLPNCNSSWRASLQHMRLWMTFQIQPQPMFLTVTGYLSVMNCKVAELSSPEMAGRLKCSQYKTC